MKCPHCHKILSDQWIKHAGATLMGRTSGEKKARTSEQASAAAHVRWGNRPLKTAEELRAINRKRQRKYHQRWKAKKEYKKLCEELAADAALLGQE